MDDKKILYNFSWKQIYTEWERQVEIIDKQMDEIIDATGYTDAREIIKHIKDNLK